MGRTVTQEKQDVGGVKGAQVLLPKLTASHWSSGAERVPEVPLVKLPSLEENVRSEEEVPFSTAFPSTCLWSYPRRATWDLFFPVGLAPQVTTHCWHLSNSLSSFSASPCCVPGTWCFAPCSAHNKTCWELWCFKLAMLKRRCSVFSLVHLLFLCLCGHYFIKSSMPVDQTVFAGILCKCEIITLFFFFTKTSSKRIITFYGWKCGSENYLMISKQWQRSRREQTIPIIHFDSSVIICTSISHLQLFPSLMTFYFLSLGIWWNIYSFFLFSFSKFIYLFLAKGRLVCIWLFPASNSIAMNILVLPGLPALIHPVHCCLS